MALTALKGKRLKKKVVRSRKPKTGIEHVPLTNFQSMCDYIHMEVEKREIVSFVKKYTKENYEKKIAIHIPFIDKIFGTYYLPEENWAEEMGLENEKFPKGYFRQFIYPFHRDPKSFEPSNPSTR